MKKLYTLLIASLITASAFANASNEAVDQLHNAILKSDTQEVQYQLDNGADIMESRSSGLNAMHISNKKAFAYNSSYADSLIEEMIIAKRISDLQKAGDLTAEEVTELNNLELTYSYVKFYNWLYNLPSEVTSYIFNYFPTINN